MRLMQEPIGTRTNDAAATQDRAGNGRRGCSRRLGRMWMKKRSAIRRSPEGVAASRSCGSSRDTLLRLLSVSSFDSVVILILSRPMSNMELQIVLGTLESRSLPTGAVLPGHYRKKSSLEDLCVCTELTVVTSNQIHQVKDSTILHGYGLIPTLTAALLESSINTA